MQTQEMMIRKTNRLNDFPDNDTTLTIGDITYHMTLVYSQQNNYSGCATNECERLMEYDRHLPHSGDITVRRSNNHYIKECPTDIRDIRFKFTF